MCGRSPDKEDRKDILGSRNVLEKKGRERIDIQLGTDN